MANIYQIKQELLAIFDELEENEGLLTPELEDKLSITRESFTSKIKDYVNVIKTIQNDVAAIKAEKARLSDLQKSKEKTIDRLKRIMADAIDQFGDTTKDGGKFIDYGTGKISVRNSDVVDINEELINHFTNRYITALRWYKNNNQLQEGLVSASDLLDFANSNYGDEESEENIKLSMDDLINLKATINTDIQLDELLGEKGFKLAKALIEYGVFDITAKADKAQIKKDAKEHHIIPSYATLVQNKSITIK